MLKLPWVIQVGLDNRIAFGTKAVEHCWNAMSQGQQKAVDKWLMDNYRVHPLVERVCVVYAHGHRGWRYVKLIEELYNARDVCAPAHEKKTRKKPRRRRSLYPVRAEGASRQPVSYDRKWLTSFRTVRRVLRRRGKTRRAP
jgi:hypothetical protein